MRGRVVGEALALVAIGAVLIAVAAPGWVAVVVLLGGFAGVLLVRRLPAVPRPRAAAPGEESEEGFPEVAAELFGWEAPADPTWIVEQAAWPDVAPLDETWPEIEPVDYGEDTASVAPEELLADEEAEPVVVELHEHLHDDELPAPHLWPPPSAATRRARHRIDPLGGPANARRGRRRKVGDEGTVVVSDGPPTVRPLPRRPTRQD